MDGVWIWEAITAIFHLIQQEDKQKLEQLRWVLQQAWVSKDLSAASGLEVGHDFHQLKSHPPQPKASDVPHQYIVFYSWRVWQLFYWKINKMLSELMWPVCLQTHFPANAPEVSEGLFLWVLCWGWNQPVQSWFNTHTQTSVTAFMALQEYAPTLAWKQRILCHRN